MVDMLDECSVVEWDSIEVALKAVCLAECLVGCLVCLQAAQLGQKKDLQKVV